LQDKSLLLQPVKSFAFILAFLVLGLSCLPCLDDVFAMNAGKEKMEITKKHNQDRQDHNDACSPFCQCACCTGFSINHFIVLVPAIQLFSNNLICCFLSSEAIGIALPVWQPPQLV
jgi:hypothetical protein